MYLRHLILTLTHRAVLTTLHSPRHRAAPSGTIKCHLTLVARNLCGEAYLSNKRNCIHLFVGSFMFLRKMFNYLPWRGRTYDCKGDGYVFGSNLGKRQI